MPTYKVDGKGPTVDATAWIAPSADVIGDALLAEHVSIWFGAVVRADNTKIRIGARTNVQEGAMLHSDPGKPLTIGSDCTIGHHAIVHGCTIGDTVLIGMGATVLNGATIGEESLVGAGALVTEGKMFPPRSLIVGTPARIVRELAPEELLALRASSAGYMDRAKLFATTMTRQDLTRVRTH